MVGLRVSGSYYSDLDGTVAGAGVDLMGWEGAVDGFL